MGSGCGGVTGSGLGDCSGEDDCATERLPRVPAARPLLRVLLRPRRLSPLPLALVPGLPFSWFSK